MDTNRRIYEDRYEVDQLVPATGGYDGRLVALKMELVRRHTGKTLTVDVGCGPGAYLAVVQRLGIPVVGVDFSRKMLRAAASRSEAETNVALIQADARSLPLADNCADLVYTFGTLYHLDPLERALGEVARILSPSGVAIIEMGNRWSFNTLIAYIGYRWSQAARPHHHSVRRMRKALTRAGLVVGEWRCFNLLPMYGSAWKLFFLYPLTSSWWKRLLGITLKGKMLDEWVSSAGPLKHVAFRHIVVVHKDA